MLNPWFPLTFRNTAAFARSNLKRGLFVLLIVAVLLSACIQWSVVELWLPVLERAVENLPEHGIIENGRLQWTAEPHMTLAETDVLAIMVDIQPSAQVGQRADLQLELDTAEWRFCSLLGCVAFPYPEGWAIFLNRPVLEPWWGARKPVILVFFYLGTLLTVLLVNLLLALFSWPAVRIAAAVTGRRCRWRASGKLAVIAWVPGLVLVAAGVLWYGMHRFGLAGLLLVVVVHLLWSVVLLLGGLSQLGPLPGHAPASGRKRRKSNPFQPDQKSAGINGSETEQDNPFKK